MPSRDQPFLRYSGPSTDLVKGFVYFVAVVRTLEQWVPRAKWAGDEAPENSGDLSLLLYVVFFDLNRFSSI